MSANTRLTQSIIYDYYEKLMDRIYLNHHSYPTNIPNYSISNAELAEMGEFDAMGRELANGLPRQARGRKQTIFHRDPDFCNGLPRRSR